MDLLRHCPAHRKDIFITFAIFFASLLAVYSLLFVIPSATEALMLEPAKLFSGEVWRLFTYQFVHHSIYHLIQNLIALLLSIMLALELKSGILEYSATYFSAGVLAIMPFWLLMPFTALGASTAVYGAFGLLSRSAAKFRIPPYMLLAVITAITLISSAYTYFTREEYTILLTLQQSASHIAGLLFGYYFGLLIIHLKRHGTANKYACLRNTS